MDAGTPSATTAAPAMAQSLAQAPRGGGVSLSVELVVALALSLLALILIVRALPWSAEMKRHRPLSCDICMCFWSTLALGVVFGALSNWPTAVLHGLPAAGLTLLFLAVLERLKGPAIPPELK